MKYIIKVKYLIIILMSGLWITSCDYLDIVPDNVPTLAHAFSDRNTTERFLATCYYNMPYTTDGSVNWTGCFDIAVCPFDILNGGTQVALGLNSASSPHENYWSGSNSLFATIRDCNTFMENVGTVKELKPDEVARMSDEAKLIKAYMHFFLTIYYGPIPTLRNSTSVNEATGDVRVFREKVDDCFAYVLEQLDEIIKNSALPDIIENRATEAGRFSLAAAYGLKARVLVFWASDLFNGNKEYSNFLDHDNQPFFNQTYDATRWEKAAQACKEALDFCASKVRLYQMDDYVPVKELSTETHRINALRNTISERWNVELIWGNSSSPGNTYSSRGLVSEYWQELCLPILKRNDLTVYHQGTRRGVPLHIAELFYSKNGVPIEEDIEWTLNSDNYKNRFKPRTGNSENKYYLALNEQTAGLHFDREPRFYSTLGFDRGKWYGNHYDPLPDNDVDCHYLQARYGEYSSMTYNLTLYNPTGYWAKKLVSLNSTFRAPTQSYYEVFPFPEMRYADLLLLAAEALNETTVGEDGQPAEAVYNYIDEIRARAGLQGVKESWKFSNTPNKPNTKRGMREIIRRERQIELALEGKHYYDARRWKTAPAQFNRLVEGWNIFALDAVDYYTKTTVAIQSFKHRDYLSPIPESEIIKNPQLIQNPGW